MTDSIAEPAKALKLFEPRSVSRKILNGLPIRDWQQETAYDQLLIVPTGKKHDSGYHVIAIVGVAKNLLEIAAYCDDIEVRVPVPVASRKSGAGYLSDVFRVDMSYPAGIARWWGAKFIVGHALSSTDVTIVESDRNS